MATLTMIMPMVKPMAIIVIFIMTITMPMVMLMFMIMIMAMKAMIPMGQVVVLSNRDHRDSKHTRVILIVVCGACCPNNAQIRKRCMRARLCEGCIAAGVSVSFCGRV